MSDVMLTARNVRKVYTYGKKEVRAVDGVSLGIRKGAATAVVGPSGAGKSTLLHLLGGLDIPTSGEVLFNGTDIYRLSDKGRAMIRNRKIGFVFQFYHLLPEFSALENVMMPGMISGIEVRRKANDLLKLVGLADRMNHKPSELSGGESQRVAIARALINEPEILLCDEPTGNLDSKTSESIYELLFSFKSRSGMSVVIITHSERVSQITDETIRMKDGRIV